jgi:hypothetical protein
MLAQFLSINTFPASRDNLALKMQTPTLNPDSEVELWRASGARPSGRFNFLDSPGSRARKNIFTAKRRERRAPIVPPSSRRDAILEFGFKQCRKSGGLVRACIAGKTGFTWPSIKRLVHERIKLWN